MRDKKEKTETEADTNMSRPRDSVNRTRRYLYIKGRPGRFRGKQQSTRRDTGKANPLPVNRRPSNTKPTRRRLLPSRRGRTSINPLCPFVCHESFQANPCDGSIIKSVKPDICRVISTTIPVFFVAPAHEAARWRAPPMRRPPPACLAGPSAFWMV